MPELPEVETIRRELAHRLVGRRVLRADSHWSAKFTSATRVVGYSVTDLARRGKFLIASVETKATTRPDPTNRRELVVHLGMTGRLALVEADAAMAFDHPHLRAWWELDNGQTLTFHDIRRFGRIQFVEPGSYASMPTLANLGPEPFDRTLDAKTFHNLLGRSRRPLKTRLLSQRPIAGVGNIYADEALWLAQINPMVVRLGVGRAGELLAAIREVLTIGINNRGTTLRDYRTTNGGKGANQHTLKAYGRGGYPCLRCDHVLHSDIIDTRTTTWCQCCQAR